MYVQVKDIKVKTIVLLCSIAVHEELFGPSTVTAISAK
jgi:hypothetical protein